MENTFQANFAGLITQFSNFDNNIIWDICLWKLDAYRCSCIDSPKDVLIDRSSNEYSLEMLENMSLLKTERTGLFERRVYQKQDGEIMWALVRPAKEEISLLFCVDSSWSHVTLLCDKTRSVGTIAFEHLAMLMPAIMLTKRNMLTFHGVLLEDLGNGIIISAPSGTGKTTHARLWRDTRNSLIINGDRAVCHCDNGIWTAYGTPWSGSSGEQINRKVPLRALVVLERAEENFVERLTSIEGFAAMLPNLLCPTWDRELVGRAMEQLDSLLKTIPVYRLHCRPDEEAVEVLYQALQEV